MGRLGSIAVGVVLVLLLAADGYAGLAPVAVERVASDPLPGDRDDRAVLAALREIDPCTLLEAGPDLAGLTVHRSGAHGCELGTTTSGPWIVIALGESDTAGDRFHGTRLTVGGAKAYGRGSPEWCRVNIPVSFRRMVTVEVRSGQSPGMDACATALDFANAAVPLLDTAHNTGPLRRWDACGLLHAALGDEVGRYDRLNENPSYDSLDYCSARAAGSGEKAFDLVLELGFNPRNPLGGVPTDGRAVRVTHQYLCVLAWTVDGTLAPDRIVQVGARDCAQTERLVPLVRRALTMRRRPVPPQRPLLYPPDEPDTAAQDACADYPYLNESTPCRPYLAGPQPPGRIDLPANPDTVCGITVAAVGRHFSGLSPVVAHNCTFVEPHHAVLLTVTAEPGAGLRSPSSGSEHSVTLAGHPGLFVDAILPRIDLQVPGGLLRGSLDYDPAREFAFGGQAPPSPVRDHAAALLAAFTEIAATYFP